VDPDTIQELFADFGAVAVRRMFGGAGLYADGGMFGLVSDRQIYLKADAVTAQDFKREGCAPFEYATKTGKRAVMSFWRLPDRLYDDPGELALWARKALAVAHKTAAAKPKPRRTALRKSKAMRPAPSRSRRR
jgi:DNA transformation protein and related proteins